MYRTVGQKLWNKPNREFVYRYSPTICLFRLRPRVLQLHFYPKNVLYLWRGAVWLVRQTFVVLLCWPSMGTGKSAVKGKTKPVHVPHKVLLFKESHFLIYIGSLFRIMNHIFCLGYLTLFDKCCVRDTQSDLSIGKCTFCWHNNEGLWHGAINVSVSYTKLKPI